MDLITIYHHLQSRFAQQMRELTSLFRQHPSDAYGGLRLRNFPLIFLNQPQYKTAGKVLDKFIAQLVQEKPDHKENWKSKAKSFLGVNWHE